MKELQMLQGTGVGERKIKEDKEEQNGEEKGVCQVLPLANTSLTRHIEA